MYGVWLANDVMVRASMDLRRGILRLLWRRGIILLRLLLIREFSLSLRLCRLLGGLGGFEGVGCWVLVVGCWLARKLASSPCTLLPL